jgi:rhodanese-related sulfurtransferase
MSLDLVVERGSGRVLGMQGLAVNGDALVGKVDVVAALLPSAPTAFDLGNVEMAYSPPFSAALDILNVLGNAADNILTGRNAGIHVDEFAALLHDGTDRIVLDCREAKGTEALVEKYPGIWINIPQGDLAEHLGALPRDKQIVLICSTGARSYEAFITLAHNGFENIVSVEGGITAVTAAAWTCRRQVSPNPGFQGAGKAPWPPEASTARHGAENCSAGQGLRAPGPAKGKWGSASTPPPTPGFQGAGKAPWPPEASTGRHGAENCSAGQGLRAPAPAKKENGAALQRLPHSGVPRGREGPLAAGGMNGHDTVPRIAPQARGSAPLHPRKRKMGQRFNASPLRGSKGRGGPLAAEA